MHITTVHIPAILALIAGILILVMPRLLNLVVAIYLICVGVIGTRSAEIASHLALARSVRDARVYPVVCLMGLVARAKLR